MSNGIRTRDILDHNQVLYQLSYTHHGPLCQWRLTNDSVSVTPLGNLRGFLPLGLRALREGVRSRERPSSCAWVDESDGCYAASW